MRRVDRKVSATAALVAASLLVCLIPGSPMAGASSRGRIGSRARGLSRKGHSTSSTKGRTREVSLIYFNKGSHIWAVRPNGKELHKVAQGQDAIIAPNGKHIYCKCGHNGGIGVMDPDGTNLRTIAHPNFSGAYLSLSGVGTLVTTGIDPDISSSSLLVGQDSASTLQPVYTPGTHEINGYQNERTVDTPFISPDGSKIMFIEYERTTQHSCIEHYSQGCSYIQRVNVINSNGSGLHTLVEESVSNDVGAVCRESIDGLAGFSTDGSTVLLYSNPPCSGGPMSSGASVKTAAADGGIERTLTPLPRNGDNALLSENGERIVFTAYRLSSSQTAGVFTVGVDGSGLRRVAPAGSGERATSWGKVVVPVKDGKTH